MKIKKARRSLSKIVSIALFVFPALALATPDGIYVGALVGSGTVEINAGDEHLSPASRDVSKLAWRAYAGYKYNLNLGLEAGYIEWGSIKFDNVQNIAGANVKFQEKSVDLMGKFMYPFDAAGSVFVEAGVTYVTVQHSVNKTAKFSGIHINKNDTFKPIFGIGANYEFYPNLLAELAYIKIPSGGGLGSSSLFGAGLTLFVG